MGFLMPKIDTPAMPAVPAAPPPPPAYGAIQGQKPNRKPMAPSFLGDETMMAGSPKGFASLMGTMGFGGQGPASGNAPGGKTLVGQ